MHFSVPTRHHLLCIQEAGTRTPSEPPGNSSPGQGKCPSECLVPQAPTPRAPFSKLRECGDMKAFLWALSCSWLPPNHSAHIQSSMNKGEQRPTALCWDLLWPVSRRDLRGMGVAHSSPRGAGLTWRWLLDCSLCLRAGLQVPGQGSQHPFCAWPGLPVPGVSPELGSCKGSPPSMGLGCPCSLCPPAG